MQLYRRTPIVVRVWENDFGLPSVNPECLNLMLVFKLAQVDVKFKRANLPLYRSIPSLEYNSFVVTKPDEMLSQLQTLCHGAPDCYLLKEDVGRILAYKKYFIHKFVPAFFYDCWINPVNYEHTIKTWYINAMLYPFGYLYTNYKRMQAHNRFKNMVGNRDTDRMILRIYYDAQCCLKDIASVLLKDKRPYFLGSNPSTLDTLIYSYLAVTLYLPLPEPYLQNLVKEEPVLVEYVDRITKNYFPDIKKTFKYVEPMDSTFEEANVKTIFITGLCVTTLMVAYSWHLGLFTNMWIPSMNDVNYLYERFVGILEWFRFPQFSI